MSTDSVSFVNLQTLAYTACWLLMNRAATAPPETKVGERSVAQERHTSSNRTSRSRGCRIAHRMLKPDQEWEVHLFKTYQWVGTPVGWLSNNIVAASVQNCTQNDEA